MKIRRLLTMLISMLLINNLIAVYDNWSELISVSNGLPNSSLNYLYFGKKGNLLVGTNNGLYLYDGYQFMANSYDSYNSFKLANADVIDVTEDKNENIWLVTQKSIVQINTKSNKQNSIINSNEVGDFKQIISDSKNNLLWVVCRDSVIQVNPTKLNTKTIFRLSDNQIITAAFFLKTLYILTSNKLFLFDSELNTTRAIPVNLPEIFQKQAFFSMADNDNLFCMIGRSLIHFDLKTNFQDIIYTFPSEITGSSQYIENSLTISTSHSVFQVKFNKQLKVTSLDKVFSSEEMELHQVIKDRNGLLWIISNKGILKINTNLGKIDFTNLSSLIIGKYNADKINFESSRQGLIVPTNNELFFFNNSNNQTYRLPIKSCNAACLINKDILIVGVEKKLLEINLVNNQITRNIEIDNSTITDIREFDNEIWVSTSLGIYQYIKGAIKQKCSGRFGGFVKSGTYVFFINDNGIRKLNLTNCQSTKLHTEVSSNDKMQINDILLTIDGKIWFASTEGLYVYNAGNFENNIDTVVKISSGNIFSLIEAGNLPEVWYTTESGIGCYNYQTGKFLKLGYEDGIRQNSFLAGGAIIGPRGDLSFITNTKIIHFFPELIFRNSDPQKVIIASILYSGPNINTKTVYPISDTIRINHKIKFAQIFFSTHDMFSPAQTRYFYSLVSKGSSETWKELDNNTLMISGLPHGIYSLKVKAINSHGAESKNASNYTLIVKAPFYQSKFGFVSFAVLLVLLILFFIQFRTRNLRKINREYKEKERIAKKIEQQKEELSLKNKNITDSINYARRIQIAMMPSTKMLKTFFPDSFLLHMPKDIVSGDFYWVNHVEGKVFFSAVDCTGHGVPGAFMSIIGVELFRRITEIEKITTPSEVLNSLSKNFERVFGDVDEMKLRDGMDLAFCSLNKDQTLLEFAGAFNPIYIIRDSSIIEVKGDRCSVGITHETDTSHSFNNHVIPLQDGDLIYIFTDGFADQFGGPEGKKYKYRRFRHLLLALHQLPMEKQEEFLRKNILEWKGNLEQVDDILIMGLRIHQTNR